MVKSGANPWESWYQKKENVIEPEVFKVEKLLKKGSKVLDAGCGTGRHAVYLAEKGFEVHAFDMDKAAVETAKKAVKDAGFNADITVHDVTNPLPYGSGYFDLVLSTRVLGHFVIADIRKIFKELDRVLKSGGIIFIQVPGEEYEQDQNTQGYSITEPGTRVPLEGPEKGVPHHHYTDEEINELLPWYKIINRHQKTEHYHGLCLVAKKP